MIFSRNQLGWGGVGGVGVAVGGKGYAVTCQTLLMQHVSCHLPDALDGTLQHVSGHLPDALDATLQNVFCHL